MCSHLVIADSLVVKGKQFLSKYMNKHITKDSHLEFNNRIAVAIIPVSIYSLQQSESYVISNGAFD
jgi:hypothetical protein